MIFFLALKNFILKSSFRQGAQGLQLSTGIFIVQEKQKSKSLIATNKNVVFIKFLYFYAIYKSSNKGLKETQLAVTSLYILSHIPIEWHF